MARLQNKHITGIETYQAGVWHDFEKYYEKFIKEQSQEDLHQMRLCIKKIYALLHLAAYAEKEIGDELVAPLVKVFDLTGKVRDLHNGHIFCKRFSIKKLVLKKREEKKKKAIKKLTAGHDAHLHEIKKMKQQFLITLPTISAITLKEYISVLIKQLEKSLKGKITVNQLHEVRKKAKELLHLLKLYTGAKLITQAKTDLLLQATDLIGEWHDINKFRKHLDIKKLSKKSLEKIKEKEQLQLAECLTLAKVYTKGN